ncbi:MAG: M28 family peptidase, partial [Candidatus Brocadiae bacterium]|nr:M28 family peptidase [Candidatus Brocadiia bacterium]
MARSWSLAICGWLLLCLTGAPVLAAAPGTIGEELDRDLRRIDPAEHVRFLSSYPSRFTGYPGCFEAQKYITQEFKDLGLANVEESTFQVVVPIVPNDERWGKRLPEAEWAVRPGHGGTLTAGGREVPLYCILPNYARTSMTGDEGITGDLVWGGSGYLADFNGKDVLHSIVLMDFASETRWLTAAKIGASAIIFVEPEHPFRLDAEQKYLDLPMPVPRYYLRRAELPALASAVMGGSEEDFTPETALEALGALGEEGSSPVQANVKALMRWEEMDVVRVSAEIPGTDPDLSDQKLILYAYYDGVSVVPALCPGAESAGGVAALLEIAEFLSKYPPRRTVKFIAAPGHYQALAGVRDYAFKAVYPRREGADDAAKEGTGEPYFFIGLDLSSRHNGLGSFYKGHFYDQLTKGWDNKEVELQRAYSEYSGLLVEWADQLVGKGGPAETLKYQSGIVPQQGRDWRSLVPDLVAYDSEVMSLSGYPAITLATTGDPRNSVNTPLDTFDRMEPYLDNVRRQAVACAYLVKKTADVPVLPIQRKEIWKNKKAASLFGFTIELSFMSYMPKVPVRNAIVTMSMLAPYLGSKSKSMMGVSTHDYKLSNVQGLFEVFGLVQDEQFLAHGFVLSPTSGQVAKLAQSEPITATARAREVEWEERETDLRLNFFRGVCTTLFDLTDPLSLRTLARSRAVRGESNGDFMKIGNWYPYLVSFVGQDKPCAVFFTKRDANVKFLLAASAVGYEGLLLNFEEEVFEEGEPTEGIRTKEQTGIGYKADQSENFIYLTAFQVVKDMHELDGRRMEKLASTGIFNQSVWDLYQKAEEHIKAAETARRDKRYDEFYDHTLRAWGVENRVYPEVRDTATDVVTGVIFYFALLLPFVLFTERLLLNFVEIRKKLAAVFVLFVVSYLVLRLVHPAFKLSQTPVMILNGFLMLVAAVATIWYLLGKFNVVMEHIRQKIDMIHRADVARASATMAAFVLGISNMRKRKVRTGLTAVTLILLTFTILSFTSFETMPARMLEYTSPRTAPYEGVLLRGLGWGPLSERVADDMMNFFRVRGMRVAPRSWFVNRKRTEELQIEMHRVDGDGEAVANAILGLSPEEAYFSSIDDEKYLEHEWFDRSMEDWPFVCILPTRMMEGLRVEQGDVGQARISVLGRHLRVVGTFSSDEM